MIQLTFWAEEDLVHRRTLQQQRQRRKLLNTLIQLVENGHTLLEAGQKLGISKSRAWRLLAPMADNVNRARKLRLTSKERKHIQALLDAGQSVREVQRNTSRSAGAIIAVRYEQIRQEMADDTEDLTPINRVRAYTCNGCGHRVNVRPCVVCQARGTDG